MDERSVQQGLSTRADMAYQLVEAIQRNLLVRELALGTPECCVSPEPVAVQKRKQINTRSLHVGITFDSLMVPAQ